MDVENNLPPHARGLTLVELVATLAVACIALAITIPSFAAIAERSAVSTTANQILNGLRYARNEAVSRQQHISLCPSDDGSTCSGDYRGWSRGYLIFVDNDSDKQRGTHEELLRYDTFEYPATEVITTAGRPAIRFRRDGAAWSTNATFSVCAGPSAKRAVILYGSGRARVDDIGPSNRPIACNLP